MNPEQTLLEAIAADPGDDTAWLALADCLEEQGETDRAELVRLREWLRTGPLGPDRAGREERLGELLLAGVRPTSPRWSVALDDNTPLELALIPPGWFFMGSPDDEPGRWADEGPRHRVSMPRGFWMGVHPVTQGQWTAVMGENPSSSRGKNRPVENVSWMHCQDFCTRLGGRLGRRCQLPSEAEWEYACRAGTTSMYNAGHGIKVLEQLGWYEMNSNRQTAAVGKKAPNARGLYDLHGNVREWCRDGMRTYTESAATDPIGDDRRYMVRGGSCRRSASFCRSAFRGWLPPNEQDTHLGCRVLVALG